MSASDTSSRVVDAGVALALVLPHPYQPYAQRLWRHWLSADIPLLAPPLWVAEVTSGLRHAVWKGLLRDEEAERALFTILRLPVERVSDPRLAPEALTWARRLNQKRAYDAFYVALAEMRQAELWSTDRRLVNALRQQGHPWAHWVGEVEAWEGTERS